MIGTFTLVAIFSGILLFLTSQKQYQQVLKSYCGDFGFYGKSLVLMKDSTFRFSYHGCSQDNGYVSGTWEDNGETLTFTPNQIDENLDFQYQPSNYELVPLNKSVDEKITLCENYMADWDCRISSIGKNLESLHVERL
ncbi:hypothetical protein [uncultured Cyclobacterium sp.]|uniref:hypothetical protein n=1 Tax=uncultured Cyclobacterium sp. TaxID=453820 RepID=UPI0030EBD1BB